MAQGGVFAGDAAAALKSGPGVGTGAPFTVGDLTGPQPAEILFPNSDRWDSAEGITEPVLSTGLGLGMGGNFTPSASLQRTGYFVSGDALRAVEEMLFNLILSDQHAGLFARIFWAPAFETDPLSAREFLQDQMELADAIVRLLFPGILDAGNEQTHGIRTHAELNRILREYARVTRPQENPDVKTTARVVSEVALQRSPVPKSTVFWIQELFARGGRRNGWIILDYLIVRPKDSLEINTRLKRSSVVSAVDMKITKSGKNERMRGDQQKDYLDTIGFLPELAQPDDTVVRAILAAASLVSVDFKQFPSPEDYLRQTVLLLREPCLLKLIHAVRSRDLSQIQDRFREFVQARWLLAGGSMTSGLEQFIMTSTQTFLGRIGLL